MSMTMMIQIAVIGGLRFCEEDQVSRNVRGPEGLQTKLKKCGSFTLLVPRDPMRHRPHPVTIQMSCFSPTNDTINCVSGILLLLQYS